MGFNKSFLWLVGVSCFVFSACIPEEQINNAVGQCREVVDQGISEAWTMCSEYYEDEVLPEVEQAIQDATNEAIENLIAELEEWFATQLASSIDEQLSQAKRDALLEFGCTVTGEGEELVWDCADSWICEE